MKNTFLPLIRQLLPNQKTNTNMTNKSQTKSTQIQHFHRNIKAKFLVGLMAGLTASTLIPLLPQQAISAPTYKTSWVGNTFGGGSKWVQNYIGGMYVAPDGTVFTNSIWDEGTRESGIYKDGNVIGKATETHGWGRLGGLAVTANSRYFYISMTQESIGSTSQDYPSSGTKWYLVRRYNLDGSAAPFSGGRGYDRSMLIINTSNHVTGLANYGNELFVADSASNRIRVYNSDTMTELRSWSVARTGQMTADQQGNIWLLQSKTGSTPAKIIGYSKTGQPLSKEITDVVDPTSLAVDNQGRLMVTENGPRQQVLIYSITGTPTMVSAFGAQGGIYSGTSGSVGDLKLYGLKGVGTDADGNIYVNSNGFSHNENEGSGTDLRKFSPTGAMQWRLLGIEFVDVADADSQTDGADVFTKHERFGIDYTKPSGQEWSYKAFTLNKFRYPDDPRLHLPFDGVFVRRINGQRYLYMTDMYAGYLAMFRFDGKVAVPYALFAKKRMSWPPNQPGSGRWVWRDQNGDGAIQSNEYENLGSEDLYAWGWEVDTNGHVWQGASSNNAIRRYRVQGFDSAGRPIYSGAATDTIPLPAPFARNGLMRLKYIPQTDTMYLAGYTNERPQGSEWGVIGREIIRYDNWSTTKTLKWRTVLPYEPTARPMVLMKAMDVAGDRVFTVDVIKAHVNVYDANTGAFITKLTPGPEVAYETGWVDIPYGIRAYRRANGEYVVFVEEDAKAKVMMYRMTP